MNNNIQYVSTVTTDKIKSQKLKCNVRKNKNLFLKNDCTWDELKELITHGCTIARVGTRSTYIALDIDDSDITHAEMLKWWNNYNDKDNVIVTASASGKEYKHHVYFNVPEYDVNEIKEITLKCFKILAIAFAGKKILLDKRAWSYWQCMYNTGIGDHTFVLKGSIQLNDWTKKFTEPVPYIEHEEELFEDETDYDTEYEEYINSDKNYNAIIPNKAEWYMNLLDKYGLSKAYYSVLPFELLSKTYVRKGNRHSSMLKAVDCVIKNYFVNYFFGYDYTIEDIQYTIKHHIETNFENGTVYYEDDKKSIQNAIFTIYEKYCTAIGDVNNTDLSQAITNLINGLGEGHHRFSIKSFAKKFVQLHNFDNIDDACIEIVSEWYGPIKIEEKSGEIDDEFNKDMTIVRHEIKTFFENKKEMTVTKDLDETKRVYELTKDIQLFDDMPVQNMSFEEFCNKSTAGNVIKFENKTVTVERKEHKQHKQHSNKGKCLEGYTIVDNTVTIPRDKVTSSIRKYCSKNNIKIVRS